MRNIVKRPLWVIVVRCLSYHHRGVIAEGDLVRFGVKPGAPVAQFVEEMLGTAHYGLRPHPGRTGSNEIAPYGAR
jgi:hypothetical protein